MQRYYPRLNYYRFDVIRGRMIQAFDSTKSNPFVTTSQNWNQTGTMGDSLFQLVGLVERVSNLLLPVIDAQIQRFPS